MFRRQEKKTVQDEDDFVNSCLHLFLPYVACGWDGAYLVTLYQDTIYVSLTLSLSRLSPSVSFFSLSLTLFLPPLSFFVCVLYIVRVQHCQRGAAAWTRTRRQARQAHSDRVWTAVVWKGRRSRWEDYVVLA